MVKRTHLDLFGEVWLLQRGSSLEPQSVFKMLCFYFLLHEVTNKKKKELPIAKPGVSFFLEGRFPVEC